MGRQGFDSGSPAWQAGNAGTAFALRALHDCGEGDPR